MGFHIVKRENCPLWKQAIFYLIAIAAALLLGAVILGAVRGLYRSVAGLLVLVLALLGANWLTETCAAGVEDCVRPVLAVRMEAIVSDAVAGEIAGVNEFSETELFSSAEALRRLIWLAGKSSADQ